MASVMKKKGKLSCYGNIKSVIIKETYEKIGNYQKENFNYNSKQYFFLKLFDSLPFFITITNQTLGYR